MIAPKHRIRRSSLTKLTFLLFISALLLVPATLSAAEADELDAAEEMPVREKDSPCLFFTIGPVGMLNTDKLSAPSPIKFSAGIGGTIPVNTWFAFTPSLTLYADYWLWRNDAAGGRAYPAEIENRTGLVPSALIELPAVFYARGKTSTFSFGLGITFFCRYAFLADGVPQAEAGDIKKMNTFFYEGLRFFYPSVSIAFDKTTESGMKAGVVAHAYVPLDSLTSDRGLDAGMVSLAFRISLANKPKVTEEPEE